MSEIKLTRGQVALVDEDDFIWLSQHRWHAIIGANYAQKMYIAMRGTWDSVKGWTSNVAMHRDILEHALGRPLSDTEWVDHADWNTLNNCKSNLRIVARAQNQQNRGPQSNNKSGYKGVSWFSPTSRWQAQITGNGIHRHLGYFRDIDDAARAYDEAARELHGEFAYQNFPKEVK